MRDGQLSQSQMAAGMVAVERRLLWVLGSTKCSPCTHQLEWDAAAAATTARQAAPKPPRQHPQAHAPQLPHAAQHPQPCACAHGSWPNSSHQGPGWQRRGWSPGRRAAHAAPWVAAGGRSLLWQPAWVRQDRWRDQVSVAGSRLGGSLAQAAGLCRPTAAFPWAADHRPLSPREQGSAAEQLTSTITLMPPVTRGWRKTHHTSGAGEGEVCRTGW